MFSLAEILCGYAISAFESFLEGKQDPGPTASSAGWWIMTVLWCESLSGNLSKPSLCLRLMYIFLKSSQSSRLPAPSCLDPVQRRADHHLFHGCGAEWEGQRTRICRELSTCHCVHSTLLIVGCVGGFWLTKQSPLAARLSRVTAQFILIYSVLFSHSVTGFSKLTRGPRRHWSQWLIPFDNVSSW